MIINYKGQELDLQPGDIVLYRNEWMPTDPITYLSVLVRLFTQCWYNHCGVIVSNWGVLTINEALGKGVVGRPAELHLERTKSKIKILRPRFEFDQNEFSTKANSALERPYSFRNLVFAQLLYRLTGIWIGDKRDSVGKGMVCSEYCAWTHDLAYWWKLSARELENHEGFDIVYIEDPEGDAKYKAKQGGQRISKN